MISLSGMHFQYGKNSPLFHDLCLNLGSGNICGLLGKNGAGKTTFLKILAGLLFPHAGVCRILGEEPARRMPAFLQDLYLVPEEFYLPPLMVKQYLDLYAPLYPRFHRDHFFNYLKEFSLPDNQVLTRMSYGQKKKFLLAFGLAAGSRLLLLDEPTNGLDIPSKGELRRLLAGAITAERTFIVSTHQVRDLENLIDPIVILDEGQIIFNQFAADTAKKLKFAVSAGTPDPEAVLYSEQTPGGYRTVSAADSAEETRMDVEALFNAVITNRHKVAAVFGETIQ